MYEEIHEYIYLVKYLRKFIFILKETKLIQIGSCKETEQTFVRPMSYI